MIFATRRCRIVARRPVPWSAVAAIVGVVAAVMGVTRPRRAGADDVGGARLGSELGALTRRRRRGSLSPRNAPFVETTGRFLIEFKNCSAVGGGGADDDDDDATQRHGGDGADHGGGRRVAARLRPQSFIEFYVDCRRAPTPRRRYRRLRAA